METQEQLMNWKSFREALIQHPDKDLQFEYAENKWVKPSYHITEIKQSPITSVDCGGKLNSWTEIIVQLWEPDSQQQERAMKVRKAISIIELVEKAMDLDPQATVKIEFGNSQFDTRQMYPNELQQDEENLVVNLKPDFTQCKALGRGGSCGTASLGEECREPSTAKPKIKLQAVVASACCEPGGGCC